MVWTQEYQLFVLCDRPGESSLQKDCCWWLDRLVQGNFNTRNVHYQNYSWCQVWNKKFDFISQGFSVIKSCTLFSVLHFLFGWNSIHLLILGVFLSAILFGHDIGVYQLWCWPDKAWREDQTDRPGCTRLKGGHCCCRQKCASSQGWKWNHWGSGGGMQLNVGGS